MTCQAVRTDGALATKGYVDDKAATSGSSGTRRVAFSANGSSSFTIGTMANIAGKDLLRKSYSLQKLLLRLLAVTS